MAQSLASLTLLSCGCFCHLAQGDWTCREGSADCDGGDDALSTLLQLHQAAPALQGQPVVAEGLQRVVDEEPIPKIDCSSQPYNGTCLARQTACVLAGLMRQWRFQDDFITWRGNENITKVKDQLTGQCYGTTTHTTTAVSAGRHLHCHKGIFSCTENVADYFQQHAGARYGMEAAKVITKATADTMRLILKEAKIIALPGSIGFAFISSFISTFFPTAGGLPANPCTYAGDTNWGRCVWKQVKPFVADFVDRRINAEFDKIWQAHLEGFHDRLWDVNTTAYIDSSHFPNGSIKTMPDKVRDKMYSQLNGIHGDMVVAAPDFWAEPTASEANGLYLGMYSSLHIQVMTAIFGSPDYRDAGSLYTYQAHILCYARTVLSRALQARNGRLSWVVKKNDAPQVLACTETDCIGNKIVYKDSSQSCHWQEICTQDLSCVQAPAGYYHCHDGPPCDETTPEANAYNCHRAYVQEQSDQFWQYWLMPIPSWLETVAQMQKAQVKPGGAPPSDQVVKCLF